MGGMLEQSVKAGMATEAAVAMREIFSAAIESDDEDAVEAMTDIGNDEADGEGRGAEEDEADGELEYKDVMQFLLKALEDDKMDDVTMLVRTMVEEAKNDGKEDELKKDMKAIFDEAEKVG